MAREISIILRAKNAMAAGLSSAGKALQSFGQSAMRIGAFFAKSFLAAGAAAAGFAAKALSAYAEQEKAERSLIAAMQAHGEEGEALIPALKKIAAAIQDETGAADESTLAGMAKMKMLGVQTSKLGEAAKAVIALKGVGLEEAAAQKAVAMAMQGSYDMLNRYVPALRSATSEAEKAQIVNELFSKGYEQQAELLDTVGGRWGLLKGRIGDVWEEIGAAIAQSDHLMAALTRAGDAVKEFGNKIAAWVEAGGVVRLIAAFKLFYNDVSHTFKLIGNTAAITWAAMGDGVDTVVQNIIGGFKYAGAYVAASWKKIRHPFSKFEAPQKSDYGFGIVTTQTEKALAARAKINEDYSKRIKEIAGEQAAEQIKHEEKVATAKANAAAADKKLAEQTTAVVKKETTKQAAARLKALNQELSEINKNKQAVEALAQSRVQAVIDEAKARKKEEKSIAKDDEKARRLAEAQDRGARLGGKQTEWLATYNKIKAAKTEYGYLDKAGQAVESKIQQEKDMLAAQEASRDYLETISKTLEKNLSYSGD